MFSTSKLMAARRAIAASYSTTPTVLIVGTSYSVSTVIAIPPHEALDEIWIFAYRNNSNTAITVPGGAGTVPAWSAAAGGTGTGTNATRLGRATASANNHTSGTWSGATEMMAIVTRGQATTALGGVAEGGSTSQTIAAAPAVTMSDVTGYSLLLHLLARRPTLTAWGDAFTGYTRELALITSTNSGLGLLTKDDTTSDGAVSIPITAASSLGYRGITAEVRCRTTDPILVQVDRVKFDNAALGDGGNLAGGVVTSYSHTARAGAYVIVGICTTLALTYVRYDGVDMTLLSSSAKEQVYGIYDLTGGTKTVTFTSASAGYRVGSSVSYLNVGSVVLNGTSTGASNNITQYAACPLGSIAVQIFSNGAAFSANQPFGGRFRVANSATATYHAISDTAVTMTFTGNAAASSDHVGVNLLLKPVLTPPAPVFDYATGVDGSFAASTSWTHLASAGAYVIVATTTNVSVVPTGVTYGGVAMTQIASQIMNNAAGVGILRFYGLANVDGGAKTVTVTYSGAENNTCAAVSYNHVTSVSAAQYSYGNSTSPSQAVTGTGTIVHAFAAAGFSDMTSPAGGTSRWFDNNTASRLSIREASVPTTFSATIGSATYWAGIGVVLT